MVEREGREGRVGKTIKRDRLETRICADGRREGGRRRRGMGKTGEIRGRKGGCFFFFGEGERTKRLIRGDGRGGWVVSGGAIVL